MKWSCFKSAWNDAINNQSVILGIATLYFAAAITAYGVKLPGEFVWSFATIGVLCTLVFSRRVWRLYQRERKWVEDGQPISLDRHLDR